MSQLKNSGHSIASADFEVVERAAEEGHKVTNLWEFLNSTETRRMWEAAWEFCDDVAETYAGRVQIDHCDVVHQIRYELVYPIAYALQSFVMAKRCMEALNPRQVSHFPEMEQAFFWDPEQQPCDIFNASVAWAAKCNGIPTVPLASLTKKIESTPASSGRAFTPVRNISRSTSKATYVAVAPGYVFLEQELLFSSFSNSDEDNWLVLTTPTDALSPQIPTQSYDGLITLPFFLPPTVETAIRLLEKESLPILPHKHGDVAAALSNPHLSFVWSYFCKALLGSAKSYLRGYALARAYTPQLLLYGSDVWGHARCFIEGVQATGTPIVSMQHSGLWTKNAVRRATGLQIPTVCWSDYDAVRLKQWRASVSQVLPVGSLRKDHVGVLPNDGLPEGAPAGVRHPRIVFLTSRVGALPCEGVDPITHREVWKKLLAWCDRKSDWQFVIKPHPRYDHHDLYESWSRKAEYHNLSVDRRPAREALATASVAILVSRTSTVAVDVCAMGIPLFYLKAANDVVDPDIFDGHGIEALEDVTQLIARVTEVVSDLTIKKGVLNKQNRFLRKVMAATGQKSVERMKVEIERLALSDAQVSEPDPALRWVFDVVRLVETVLRGGASLSGAAIEFDRLRINAKKYNWQAFRYFEPSVLGSYLAGLPTAWSYYAPKAPSRTGVVKGILKTLPKILLPSRAQRSALLRDACYLDAELAELNGRRLGHIYWKFRSRLCVR